MYSCMHGQAPQSTVPDGFLPFDPQRRITATTPICQPTTSSRSTLPAKHHSPTGFLCGWSVGVEFLARLLARFWCWQRPVASPAPGHWGTCPPPSTSNSFIFSSLWSKSDSKLLCSLRDQLMQMSITHNCFDQYCISHKTISLRAAAARGPEVHRECLNCWNGSRWVARAPVPNSWRRH